MGECSQASQPPRPACSLKAIHDLPFEQAALAARAHVLTRCGTTQEEVVETAGTCHRALGNQNRCLVLRAYAEQLVRPWDSERTQRRSDPNSTSGYLWLDHGDSAENAYRFSRRSLVRPETQPDNQRLSDSTVCLLR